MLITGLAKGSAISYHSDGLRENVFCYFYIILALLGSENRMSLWQHKTN